MNRTSPIVVLVNQDALDTKADATFGLSVGTLQPFVDLADLESAVAHINPYATYEPNFWLLDGNYRFAPSAAHVGLMTTNMSDGSSNFGTAPTLQITFGSVHSTTGLKLYFSEFSGDWADSITVKFYNASDVLIQNNTYTPSVATFETNQAVSNFKKIEILFNSTNKAQRYARLTGIDFDDITTFSGADIKEARLVEEIDPICVELPINTIDLTLFNANGDFSIVSPAGFYANLQYKEPLDMYERVNNEVIYIGRFYLDTWESLSENEASFHAFDAIGILDSVTYLGEIWDVPGGVSNLVPDILDDLFTTAGIDYELDATWNSFAVSGHLPICTAREALQNILFSLGNSTLRITAIATCARSNVVRILALPLTGSGDDLGFTITTAEKAINSPLTLKPLVTGIEIAGYSIVGTVDDVEVYNVTLEPGTYTITLDEPMFDIVVSGTATRSATTEHVNYVLTTVTVTGTVIITGKKYLTPFILHTKLDENLDATLKPNVVSIDAPLIGYNLVVSRSNILLYYFQQRYLQKTKLFASLATVGDSVLIDTQSGRKLMGTVERMETDLARGMVQQTEIVGAIVDPMSIAKYNGNSSKLIYSGTWKVASDASAYSSDLHYVDVGDSGRVDFSFYGTRFKLVYTKASNRGSVEIRINGALVTTLNMVNGSTLYQQEWDSGTLSGDFHVVRIEKVGTANLVDVDAIEIL